MGYSVFSLRPADAITVFFLFFLVSLVLIFWGSIPNAPNLIMLYSTLLCIQFLLIRMKKRQGAMEYVRDIAFPVASVLIIFDSLEWIVKYINPMDIDHLLIRMDYMIFRTHPTVWLERLVSPMFTDMLQLAYTSYYFLPVTLGIALKSGGKNAEFDRSLFLILFCFYLSYIGYILMPAIGPRYTMGHLQEVELGSFLVAEPIQDLLNRLEGVKRDAFPSGHTGIALTVLLLSYKFEKRLFRFFLIVVSALVFSTVYCRYHYFVDVIGGIGLTALTFMAGDRCYDFWQGRLQRKKVH